MICLAVTTAPLARREVIFKVFQDVCQTLWYLPVLVPQQDPEVFQEDLHLQDVGLAPVHLPGLARALYHPDHIPATLKI